MPILVCCCLAQFLGVLDASIVNVALASIRDDLGFSTTGLQWVVNAYALACAGFLLLGGRAADLFGRREVFAVGAAVFGAASLAGGLAGDPATLVAARAAQGLGGAVMAPTSLSILARTYEVGAARNRAFAWWGTMGGLGGASGALLGGVLTEALSWRAILLVNAPCAIVLAVVSLRVIPRFGRRPGAFDLPGALAVTAGLALVEYGIVAETFEPIAVGGALLALFGLIESRLAPAPLLPSRMLRSRGLSGAIAASLCLGGAAVPMWYLVSLHAQRSLGFSALQTGLTFLPMSLTIVACTQAAARLAARAGAGRVLAAGMMLLGAGMLAFSRTGSWASVVLVPSLLCACGIGCSFVSTTISATSGVPPDDSGLAAGLVNTAFQIGGSLGLALLATIAAAEGFERAFAAGGCVAFTGAAVAWLVIRRSPSPGRHARPHRSTSSGAPPPRGEWLGSEAALFAVLDGRIEPVQRADGVERVVGVRHPGEIFGEVPITLGTVFPVGFRAAVPSRVMRIEPRDYHAVASASPDLAKEVGRLASHRMSGTGGLQGLAANPPPPRAIVVGLLETNVPGIFACGDVRFAPVKRVAAAVGEGSMAIAFVHQYLRDQ